MRLMAPIQQSAYCARRPLPPTGKKTRKGSILLMKPLVFSSQSHAHIITGEHLEELHSQCWKMFLKEWHSQLLSLPVCKVNEVTIAFPTGLYYISSQLCTSELPWCLIVCVLFLGLTLYMQSRILKTQTLSLLYFLIWLPINFVKKAT